MTDERMNWINARAYDLWQRAGRPHGKDQEHWLQAVAERDLMEQTRASQDGAEVLAINKVNARKANRRHRVLIVEDEPILRFDAVNIISTAGFHTLDAANADEALTLLKNNRIDTLYADISMPGSMDGLGLANRVLSLWPKTKIILVSGFIRMTSSELGKGMMFVAKPVSPATLVRLVATRGATGASA